MANALATSPRALLGQARAWGWPFAAGVAGLVAAAVISLWLVPRLQQESRDVAVEADHAARRALQSASAVAQARRLASGPTQFAAAFPASDARQSRVAALLELAVHHALSLRRSEFQLTQDKATGLVRYSVSMPLSGPYVQLRAFVEEALAGDNALSLDHLQLRRASANASVVEADLKWSFYMRPGTDAAPGPSR
jgi:hypothetical protein